MDDRKQPYYNTHSGDSTTDTQPQSHLLEKTNMICYSVEHYWKQGLTVYNFIKSLRRQKHLASHAIVKVLVKQHSVIKGVCKLHVYNLTY